jgi:hypothetical protein
MDISKLSLAQLKVLAYDTGRQLNENKQNLQILNEVIFKKEQDEKLVKSAVEPIEGQGKETCNQENDKVVK